MSATSTRRPGRHSAGRTPRSPTCSIRQLAEDSAIAAADTLMLTVPNQLGVDYNAHVIESVLRAHRSGLGLALNRRLRGRGY